MNLYMMGIDINYIDSVHQLLDVTERSFKQFKQDNKNFAPNMTIELLDFVGSWHKDPMGGLNMSLANQIISLKYEVSDHFEQNYVAKYCLKIMDQHFEIFEYDSFKSLFDEIVINKLNISLDVKQLLLTDVDDQLKQCILSISHISALKQQIHYFKDSQCVVHERSVEAIQNYYKKIYHHNYDYDWKINNTMSSNNLSISLDKVEKVSSVDEIQNIFRSIFYYDTLQSWKKWQVENDRNQQYIKQTISTQNGPIGNFQERFIFYQSLLIPYTHVQYRRHSTREERKVIEQQILKLQKGLEFYKTHPVHIDQDKFLDQINDVIQEASNDIGISDIELNAKKVQGNFFLSSILWVKDLILKSSRFIQRMVDHEQYLNQQIQANEKIGLINPHSGFDDRFKLLNQEIHQELYDNNLNRNSDKDNLIIKNNEKTLKPSQGFYLNPKYKNQVFVIPPRYNLTIEKAVFYEPLMLEQHFDSQVQSNLTQIKNESFNIDFKKYPYIPSKFEVKREQKLFNHHQSMANQLHESHKNQIQLNKMQLLIKNNLTVIQPIDLKARSSTAFLDIIDTKKEFTNISKKVNDKGETVYVSKSNIISIKDSMLYNMTANKNISRYSNMHFMSQSNSPQSNVNMTQNYDIKNIPSDLKTVLAGSDIAVQSSLFDQVTKKQHHQKQKLIKSILYNAQQSIMSVVDISLLWPSFASLILDGDHDLAVEDIIQQNNYQYYRNWTKEEQIDDNLKYQTFNNYIVFNIPLSDIFRKKVNDKIAEEIVDYDGIDDEECSLEEIEQQARESKVKGQLFLADKTPTRFFYDKSGVHGVTLKDPATYLNEQKAFVRSSQKKMIKHIDMPNIQNQIALQMDKWDTQDFRIDLNWTQLIESVNKVENLEINYVHQRLIVMQNIGTVPMTIFHMYFDDQKWKEECQDSSRTVKILNCNSVKSRIIYPRENITMNIIYKEKFSQPRSRRTLTIETEYFTQKYLIDFVIPKSSIALVKRAESVIQSANEGLFIYLFKNICKMILTIVLALLVVLLLLWVRRTCQNGESIVNHLYKCLSNDDSNFLNSFFKYFKAEDQQALTANLNFSEIYQKSIQEQDPSLENEIVQQYFSNNLSDQKDMGIQFSKDEKGQVTFKLIPMFKVKDNEKQNLDKLIEKLHNDETDRLNAENQRALEQLQVSLDQVLNPKRSTISMTQPVPKQQPSLTKKQRKELKEKAKEKEPPKVQQQEATTTFRTVPEQVVSKVEKSKAVPEPKVSKQELKQENSNQHDNTFSSVQSDPITMPSLATPTSAQKKPKKQTKQELKKMQARLKKELELKENRKKIELQELEKQKNTNKNVAEFPPEDKLPSPIDSSLDKVEDEGYIQVTSNPRERKHHIPPQIDTDLVDIKSYHSSEEERKIKRKKLQNTTNDLLEINESIRQQEQDHNNRSSSTVVEMRQNNTSSEQANTTSNKIKKSMNYTNFWQNYEKNIYFSKKDEKEDEFSQQEKDSFNQIVDNLVDREQDGQEDDEQILKDIDQEVQKHDQQSPELSENNSIQIKNDNSSPKQDSESFIKNDKIDKSDSDSDLPLFQQKKYIQILQQEKKQVNKKNNQEVRKVIEQSSDEESKFQQQKQQLQKLRNIKADINNPNNKLYKGRPENRDIEKLIKQQSAQIKARSAVDSKTSDQHKQPQSESSSPTESDQEDEEEDEDEHDEDSYNSESNEKISSGQSYDHHQYYQCQRGYQSQVISRKPQPPHRYSKDYIFNYEDQYAPQQSRYQNPRAARGKQIVPESRSYLSGYSSRQNQEIQYYKQDYKTYRGRGRGISSQTHEEEYYSTKGRGRGRALRPAYSGYEEPMRNDRYSATDYYESRRGRVPQYQGHLKPASKMDKYQESIENYDLASKPSRKPVVKNPYPKKQRDEDLEYEQPSVPRKPVTKPNVNKAGGPSSKPKAYNKYEEPQYRFKPKEKKEDPAAVVTKQSNNFDKIDSQKDKNNESSDDSIQNQIFSYPIQSIEEINQEEQQPTQVTQQQQDKNLGQKSIYETFMDISSIFSNKRVPFNQNKTNKSRFFNDPGSESEEEKDQGRNYAHNQRNYESNDNDNSIFSSGDMFNQRGGTNTNVSQHQAPMNEANLQPVFNMFGQSTRLPEHYQQQINPTLYDGESQSEYEAEQRNFVFSPPQMDPKNDQEQENPGPGLYSKSFANLRKRALDAGTSYESTPQAQQQSTSSATFIKPQLGDLSVPKFIQEQRQQEMKNIHTQQAQILKKQTRKERYGKMDATETQK